MDIKKSWLCNMPISHRGLHNSVCPENSLLAFEQSIKNNFAIELDVRIIDDENIIVFHDDKLSRMTNSDGYACNLVTSGLKDLKLNKTDAVIPTFAETLEFVNGKVPLLIEIKNEAKIGILESKVAEMLSQYNGEFAVQSFNPYSMGFFKENAPHILRGQLASYFKGQKLAKLKKFFLKRLKLNNISCPDFISYDADNLPNKYVTKTNLPILAWTIRSNAQMEKLLNYCDNIIFEKFIPEFENK